MKLPGQEQHRTSSAKLGDKMPAKARQVMRRACCEIAMNRPTFEELEKSLRSAISGRQTNLLDRYERIQVAQLSQRDRAAGCVSFGQKWKTGTGTGRQYFMDIIGLFSTTVT